MIDRASFIEFRYVVKDERKEGEGGEEERKSDGEREKQPGERVTGERKDDRERGIIYHPAVYRRNSLQMLFNLPDGKPSCLPSFLESRGRVDIPALLTSFPYLLLLLCPTFIFSFRPVRSFFFFSLSGIFSSI